mgnify:CR=1 FL=1
MSGTIDKDFGDVDTAQMMEEMMRWCIMSGYAIAYKECAARMLKLAKQTEDEMQALQKNNPMLQSIEVITEVSHEDRSQN